jgi:hypothetical protein
MTGKELFELNKNILVDSHALNREESKQWFQFIKDANENNLCSNILHFQLNHYYDEFYDRLTNHHCRFMLSEGNYMDFGDNLQLVGFNYNCEFIIMNISTKRKLLSRVPIYSMANYYLLDVIALLRDNNRFDFNQE